MCLKLTESVDIDKSVKPPAGPGEENPALKYFMEVAAETPTASQIKESWPLSHEAF